MANDTVDLNLPQDIRGWRDVVERSKGIYWGARRDGKDENEALVAVVDDILHEREMD